MTSTDRQTREKEIQRISAALLKEPKNTAAYSGPQPNPKFAPPPIKYPLTFLLDF
jgi:hypothetical protein